MSCSAYATPEDAYLRSILAYVRASALHYATYYKWTTGDAQARSWYMQIDKRDWELAAAEYKVLKRKYYLNNIFRGWKGLHP